MSLTIVHGWHTVPMLPKRGSCRMVEHQVGHAWPAVTPRQLGVSQNTAGGQMRTAWGWEG